MSSKKSTPESIKSELNAILQLNAKRKAALEKISKNITEKKNKIPKDKILENENIKSILNLKL
ncbi:MAG: hypothetical protein QM503_03445 [Bacteroidota bacterium]